MPTCAYIIIHNHMHLNTYKHTCTVSRSETRGSHSGDFSPPLNPYPWGIPQATDSPLIPAQTLCTCVLPLHIHTHTDTCLHTLYMHSYTQRYPVSWTDAVPPLSSLSPLVQCGVAADRTRRVEGVVSQQAWGWPPQRVWSSVI